MTMNFFDEGYQPLNCKSGADFELWVQRLLNQLGFKAKLTGENDNGVDIIADINIENQFHKFYIQCKFYNRVLGKEPVQQIYTGHNYFGGDGHPVVITNNKMSIKAKAYAGHLNVEVISQYQLEELDALFRTKKLINDRHTGLMGIIVGKMVQNQEIMNNAVKIYKKKIMTEKITYKERLENELINTFEQANLLLQESAELQFEANMRQQKALELQKEALLRNLNCP